MTVLVVGALHLDVVVTAPHLPALDETVTGSRVAYIVGGKGGNQARAIAQLGGEVAFAGRIGADEFGQTMRHALQDAGVDLGLLQQDDGASGMSTAIVDANGDYGAVIVSESNLRIEPERIDIPEGTQLLLLQNEVPEAVNLAMLDKAHAVGAKVWLNAAPARNLDQRFMEEVDLMIVNRQEQVFYGDLSAVSTIATRGGEGLRFAGAHFPAFDVPVVSSHGAGDMFVGALAKKVAAGASITDAIPFAQAAAALFVSSTIAQRTSVDATAVEHFLKDHPRASR